jgi:hypothetical protein
MRQASLDSMHACMFATPRRSTARRWLVLLASAGIAAGAGAIDAADARGPRIPAHATIGKTTVSDAKFEFACSTGEGGMLSIRLILPPPESIAGFALDKFEGPDGIGETRDLAEWSVSGAPKPARARTSISGWRGVDGDGFLLAKARESSHTSDIARVAKRLVSSEQARLRLVVKPPSAHGGTLKVEALIAGHREDVAKALAPCLAHVK